MTEQDEKHRLIEQMRSRDNAEALTAVEALRARGWLTDGTLCGANLREANLPHTDLHESNLTGANLTGANLTGAVLIGANLVGVMLGPSSRVVLGRSAKLMLNLTKVASSGANLAGANLARANLNMASLNAANLTQANLVGADFSEAKCSGTIFADVDLSGVNGLETIKHLGPSSLDTHTLLRSKNLPEAFLRGCGLPDSLIAYLPSLREEAIQFYSSFISYSHADADFARLLHDRLQVQGIRCWLDEYEINPGDKIVREVSEAIRVWDKVLLCCSETALHSWWVDKEITMVLGKEEELTKQRGEEVLALIPLDLDGYLFDAYQGEYEKLIKARNVAGFQGWKSDHDLFEAQLARVVRALTVGGGKLPPPEPKL